MSDLSGFQGYLFLAPALWPGLDDGRLQSLYLHAPRGAPGNPDTLRKLAALYRLVAGRLDAEGRRAFVDEIAHKERGDWGEPARLWPVILEDPDLAVVRHAGARLAEIAGRAEARGRALRLQAVNPARAGAVLAGVDGGSAGA